jgi:hypothetical protein
VASIPSLAGLPADVATEVKQIATDLQQILAKYGAPKTSLTLAGAKSPGLGRGQIHFKQHDRERLIALRAQALGLLAAVQQKAKEKP